MTEAPKKSKTSKLQKRLKHFHNRLNSGGYNITSMQDYKDAKGGNRKIVHIHMHSIFSISDAMVKPMEVAARAKELGIDTIILTDHGVISGIVQMKQACLKYGIKFIPACEMYEAPGGINADRTTKNLQSENRHITMIPVNNEGWGAMQYIIQDANMNGFHYNPRTDVPFIKSTGMGKNIIATSGCLGGEIAQLLLAGSYEEAKAEAIYRTSVFHTFFLEIQDNGSREQEIVNQALIQIGEETGIPLVFAKDVHYVMADHKIPHHTLVAMSRKQNIHDCNPYPGTNTYHYAGADEVYKWAKDNQIPLEAIENTQKLADMCNVDVELGKDLMPAYEYVEEGHTPETYLRKLLYDNMIEYVEWCVTHNNPIDVKKYIERVEYEYKVICDKRVPSYFLILWDILLYSTDRNKWLSYPANLKWIMEQDVIEGFDDDDEPTMEIVMPNAKYQFYPEFYVGPGRGSAAGSMIAFLLDITRLDPLEYDLLFERFLNPDRKGLPDIDVDFPGDNHDLLIDFVAQRYGRDKTAQVRTFTAYKLKATIDKTCKAMEEFDPNNPKKIIKYGRTVAEEVKATINMIVNDANKMPDADDVTYKDMMAISMHPEDYERYGTALPRAIEASKQFRKMMEKYPELNENIKHIEGSLSGQSIHAGAVIISSRPLELDCPTIMPDEKSKAVLPITMYDYPDCEALGLLKMDLLRTATLRIISQALAMIEGRTGKRIHIYDIGRDDEKVFEYMAQGNTHGLFQIAGGGITGYTKQVAPKRQAELIDILAIYRPGPLDAVLENGNTIAQQYVINGDKKKNREYLATLPEDMREVLKKARGQMIYQESVMTLVRNVSGYSRGQADGFRSVISKKKIPEIKKQYDIFVHGHEYTLAHWQEALDAWDGSKKVHDDKGVEQILWHDNHAKRELPVSLDEIKDAIKDISAQMLINIIPGAIAKGYKKKFADNLFRQIEAFAAYAFNKSHSACYADETYQTAWLKYYYPTEYMAALLTVRGDDKDAVLDNLKETKRMGIKILPPHINESAAGFAPSADAIRFGIRSINGVGDKAIEYILEMRRAEKFKDFTDFMQRVVKDFVKSPERKTNPVNRSVIRQLIKAGCFDTFEANRYSLLNHYNFDLRGDKRWVGSEMDLETDSAKKDHSFVYDATLYNEKRMLQMEFDLIGIYVTKSPYEALPYVAAADMDFTSGWREKATYDVGGQITKINIMKIKNGKSTGKSMAHVFVETQFEPMRLTFFADEYEEYSQHLYVENILVFRVYKKKGTYKGADTEDLIGEKVLVKQGKKLKKEMGISSQKAIGNAEVEVEETILPIVEQSAPRPDPVAGLFDDKPAKKKKKRKRTETVADYI